MAESTKQIISTLNQLIQTLKDGEEGFKQASEGVTDPEIKVLLLDYSEQRREFAHELQDQVASLGNEPQEAGSVLGALHRGWIDIKAAVSGQDEDAIIAECERGEDAAVETYTEALSQDLPSDLEAIIQRQYVDIKDAHDRIRALERSAEVGAGFGDDDEDDLVIG